MNQNFACYYLMVMLIFENFARFNCKKHNYNCDSQNWTNHPTDALSLDQSENRHPWFKVTQENFVPPCATGPVLRKDSLLGASCSPKKYEEKSPMAYLHPVNDNNSISESEHRQRVVAYQNFINGSSDDDARKYEESICYRQAEALECINTTVTNGTESGQCQCPHTGNFAKLQYQEGPYRDKSTWVEVPGTVDCISPLGCRPDSPEVFTWYSLTQKYFRGASFNDPILLKNSIYDAPCSIQEYQRYSPIAYVANITPDDPEQHYDNVAIRVIEYLKQIAEKNDSNAKRSFQKNICYREEPGEYLECLEGKCRCPVSGIFAKFRYHRGYHVDAWTGKENRKTVACLSSSGAYCIRNSRSCSGGGRCISFGAIRPWPWTCVTGTCRGNEGGNSAKSSSSLVIIVLLMNSMLSLLLCVYV